MNKVLLFSLLVGYVAAQVSIQGIIRDQAPNTMLKCGTDGTANNGQGFTGTDFQPDLGTYLNNEKGLVGAECNAQNEYTNCGRIGADRTPVYAYPGASPGATVKSPASFYNWFHDSNESVNIAYGIPLSYANGYNTYNNNAFFPIDGEGWEDSCPDSSAARTQHNYAWCFESHFRFGYTGGEVFSLTASGSAWFYVNDLLLIDLGGIHQTLTESISFDHVPGLVKGSTYEVDFFYCNLHTTISVLDISASVTAYCAYYDWCGVCEGDGSTCSSSPQGR